MMNNLQRQAFDLVSKGHNVYIGGQAGTGKSYLVSELVKWARGNDKTVGLTCTTGVACCLYPTVSIPNIV